MFSGSMGVLCSSPVPPAARFAGRRAFLLGRIGGAGEIGGPVLFLASLASRFVPGAVLTADGGWTAW
jgi:gluconate 5-dehydrogenase